MAKRVPPLRPQQVEHAKPADKTYTLFDGFGLYVEIVPSGSKLWKMKTTLNGKPIKLSFGRYPEVTLAKARRKREEVRKLISRGIDPRSHRKAGLLSNTGGKTSMLLPIFPLGKSIPESSRFSGSIWVKTVVDPDDTFNCRAVNVTFEAGCRNNWHTHSKGQILLCTDGFGRYQERGKEIIQLKPGDVIKIPPDIEHWHGAAPNSSFTHIALDPDAKEGTTVWLEPVSDEDYLGKDTGIATEPV